MSCCFCLTDKSTKYFERQIKYFVIADPLALFSSRWVNQGRKALGSERRGWFGRAGARSQSFQAVVSSPVILGGCWAALVQPVWLLFSFWKTLVLVSVTRSGRRELVHCGETCRETPGHAFLIRLLSLALLLRHVSAVKLLLLVLRRKFRLMCQSSERLLCHLQIGNNLAIICSWWLLVWDKRKDEKVVTNPSQLPFQLLFLLKAEVFVN